MSAELLRIMQRCSKQQFAVPKDYRKRLGQSGYRHSTSEGKGEMARYPTESGEKPGTFVHMFKELNSNAKRCGMPMKFASRGGRILHYKFAPPAERHKAPPPPCNPDQQDDPIWHLQGTVYEHECIEQGCPKGSGRYIGQSGNALHRRNKDHARSTKKGEAASPFVEHYDEYHTENGKRKPLRIKTSILTSGKTHVKRTISEALRIIERNPDGNRKGEHVAQTLLYIGLNEEERDGHRRRVYRVE